MIDCRCVMMQDAEAVKTDDREEAKIFNGSDQEDDGD